MKQSQTNFQSVGNKTTTEKFPAFADLYSGISYLPARKVERMAEARNLSPKKIEKKINTFVTDKIMNNAQRTAVMFEELQSNTSKIHRQALRKQLDNFDGGPSAMPRGQTAGSIGIRLNPKLASQAGMRGTITSQVMDRRNNSNSAYRDADTTTAAGTTLRSGGNGYTRYPGQPFKVSQESVLGQTLNKFELGEQDKNKLKQISGVEYYKQHIHGDQQQRLKKYVKDPSGHAPNSKRFIPLSDVEKPSMQGRVKMYMQRMTDEEKRDKNRNVTQRVTQKPRLVQDQLSIRENGQHSQSMLGSVQEGQGRGEELSPNRTGNYSTAAGAYNMASRQTATGNLFSKKRSSQQPDFNRGKLAQIEKPHATSRQRVGTDRKMSDANLLTSAFNKQSSMRLGKSLANPKTQVTMREVDEEDEQLQLLDYNATPNKGKGKAASRKKSDKGMDLAALDKTPFKPAIMKKQTETLIKSQAKTALTQTEQRRHQLKGESLHQVLVTISEQDRINFLYQKVQKFKIFELPDPQQPSSQTQVLKDSVAKRYRKIFNSKGKKEVIEENKDTKADKGQRWLQTARMTKPYLTNFLKNRYTGRIANKLAAIFDWSNPQLEYYAFYERVDSILFPQKDPSMNDQQHMNFHIRSLKKLAFQMLDMNCDLKICETDLFSFMELHKDSTFFEQVLIHDMRDIVKNFEKTNHSIRINDKTMDRQDEKAPKIIDLEQYLEQTRERIVQRKEVVQQDLYMSTLHQTSTIVAEGGSSQKGGQPSIDHSDPYSGYGKEFKQTFNKMIGATKIEKKHVVVVSKDTINENKQATRGGGVLEQILKDMRSQGSQQFIADHKKKPMISYFIHKTDDIYESKKSKVFLTEDEFIDNIDFKFGIPLVVLDFMDQITGSDYIETVQMFINPIRNNIERFDVLNNDKFNELKSQVNDEFLPYIFQIFNALGVINIKELGKNATEEEKYSKQFITLESMKEKLPKVFGVKNDFLAEMLFIYISEQAPLTHVINFYQFFSRLKVFWPKKKFVSDFEDQMSREWRKRNARQAKKSKMKEFMYDFIRLSGGNQLNILDLVKLCCYFPKDSCSFGKESDYLMTHYKQINIEPKYVHSRQEFGFQQYTKYVPYSVIIDDLKMAFAGQIKARIRQLEVGSNHHQEYDEMENFRLCSWKMESVFDESLSGQAYSEQLQLREGRTAERLFKEKKVEEKKLDRGFDIVRTWEIQSFLNLDKVVTDWSLIPEDE